MKIRVIHTIIACVVLAFAGPVSGQDAGQIYQEAKNDREAGEFLRADSLLQNAIADSSDFEEAEILLAELYLEDLDEPAKAKRIIKDALDRDPDNIELQALDLLRRYKYPPVLLPNLHEVRIARAARNILEKDSLNSIANLVLGTLALQRFRDLHAAVNFTNFNQADFESGALATVEPSLTGSRNRRNIEYESRGVGFQQQVDVVQKGAYAEPHFLEAQSYLNRAIKGEPAGKLAYTTLATLFAENQSFDLLTEVAHRMQEERPGDVDAYLYETVGAYYTGEVDGASRALLTALRLMTPEQRRRISNLSWILNDRQKAFYDTDPAGFAQTFWLLSNPRFLTDNNERQLEHYARVIYADLRFGQMFSGKRGWETEPGQVIVRYGVPQGESTFSSTTDSYHMMVYPEFGFRFMDLAKAGRLTFYSPKVSNAPSFEAIRRAWNDDTIKSAEYFREQPQISRFDAHQRKTLFDYSLAFFKGKESLTDVVVLMQIPADSFTISRDTVSTGVFLLKDGTLVRSTRDAEIYRGVENITSHTVTASSGKALVSVEFDSDGNQPVGFIRSEVEVPEADDDLFVSSLIPARIVEEDPGDSDHGTSGFMRKGHWIAPTLDGDFNRGDPVYLYFEVNNLRRDVRGQYKYKIEAFLVDDRKGRGSNRVIRRLSRRRGGRGVAVSFNRSSRQDHDAVYISVDTSAADAGKHVIAVRITDKLSGKEVYSASSIELR